MTAPRAPALSCIGVPLEAWHYVTGMQLDATEVQVAFLNPTSKSRDCQSEKNVSTIVLYMGIGWVEMCTAGLAVGALAGSSHELFVTGGEATVQAALIGGTTVLRPADMPFAFVRMGVSGCHGALIHKRAVLTASHCVPSLKMANFVIIGSKNNTWPSRAAQTQVLGSGTQLSDILRYRQFMERYAWVHDVERVWDWGYKIVNPNDPSEHQTLVNDLALLILKKPSHLPVAMLPDMPLGKILPGKTLYMFGAGIDGTQDPPGFLKVASSKFSSKSQCVDFVNKYKAHIPGAFNYINAINDPTMFCQITPKGVSLCNGDSGGPVTYISPSGKHVVVGVVSSGSAKCGTELPAGSFNILTNVYYYSKRLRNILSTL